MQPRKGPPACVGWVLIAYIFRPTVKLSRVFLEVGPKINSRLALASCREHRDTVAWVPYLTLPYRYLSKQSRGLGPTFFVSTLYAAESKLNRAAGCRVLARDPQIMLPKFSLSYNVTPKHEVCTQG
jgi:hypothetical protein